MAITVIPNNDIIPCRFPLENISSLYLLALTVCLFVYYYTRVVQHSKLKNMMLGIALMEVLLILLRGIKWSVFGSVFFPARYMWYLFYIPMLFIPVMIFYISLYVRAKDEKQVFRKWGRVAYVTIGLILLVLTNDFHQMAYKFQPGFENWDQEYSHGWIFILLNLWEYGFYVAAEILQAKVNIHDEMNRLMMSTLAADNEDGEEVDRILTRWKQNALILCMETESDICCLFENDGVIPRKEIRFTGGLLNLSILAEEQNATVSVEKGETFRLFLNFCKNNG